MLLIGNCPRLWYKVGAAAMRAATVPTTPRVALDEPPDVVAVAAVPFRPPVAREVAYLIQPGCVPGLRHHFCRGQLVVQFDLPDHRRMRRRQAILATRQNRAFVEAEAIHMASTTQYRRQSTISFWATGWLQLNVLPQPEKSM